MHPTTRPIVITRLSCAVILLLLALAWPEPALAQQTFSIDFPKKAGLPNSCMTQQPGGNGGTFLVCQIVLPADIPSDLDRKSTRLNSSHGYISYAVFCLKKKKDSTRTARS